MSAGRESLFSEATRPTLVDLFCGAGGAARGYQLAGFYVLGVDHRPQPNYCGDAFVQEDALVFMRGLLRLQGTDRAWDVDAIHASPPCKLFTVARRVHERNRPTLFEPHENLIPLTRDLLKATGLPYVIENVPAAPLVDPVTLCGSMFGLRVRRHRLFETNWPCAAPACRHAAQGEVVGVYGDGGAWTRTAPGGGGRKVAGAEAAEALGIDWTEHQPELAQAIPPAYTEHIGCQLLAHVRAEVAA